jgi:predicted branched-subunit amino acid permease
VTSEASNPADATGAADAAGRGGLSPTRRREVVRQAWSVGVASGTYGISVGALSVAAGLDVWQAQVLSLVLFTGGSQFAFVGIIATGGLAAAPAAIATSSLLGVRNGLYGLQTSRLLRVTGVRRLAAAHLTLDESTAVAIAQPEPAAQRLGFWHTGIAVFTLWNLSTLLGSLLGNALGDPRSLGLDAAAAAAFVALLWPRLRSRDATATAVLAVFIALLTSPVLPAGVPVLLAAAAALLVGLRRPGRHERPLEGDTLVGSDPTP